jgi:hypothetical protein
VRFHIKAHHYPLSVMAERNLASLRAFFAQ